MIASVVAAIVSLTNEFGTVDVDTFGANVLSYVPAGGREVFFRQPEERRTDQWYHGGVPVCWPWFGRYGDPGSVLHGFAWSQEWTADAVENGKGLSRAVLRLEWKDKFRLTYEVRLDRELSLRLSMQNLGREKFVVTTGLHPYFSVFHPRNITVDTPQGPIRCREAMDGGRPFGAGTYRISDSGWSRTLDLTTFGNNKIVIWSADPGENLPGLPPADLTKYICVEPAVLPRCDGFYLKPGQTYDIGMSCRVADSAETEIALPGEPCEKPAIGCAPFPDRMSAPSRMAAEGLHHRPSPQLASSRLSAAPEGRRHDARGAPLLADGGRLPLCEARQYEAEVRDVALARRDEGRGTREEGDDCENTEGGRRG